MIAPKIKKIKGFADLCQFAAVWRGTAVFDGVVIAMRVEGIEVGDPVIEAWAEVDRVGEGFDEGKEGILDAVAEDVG